MKKKIFAAMLCVAIAATSLVGCGSSGNFGKDTANSSEKNSDGEKVELTIWETSRNKDDWYTSMEKKFLEEHPNITLNKVVKEGDPGNEFYQAVASGTAPDLVNCSFTMMDSYITSESLNL